MTGLKNWNGSIAIKLTAIILWSVMISAFALTVPIMMSYEEEKLKSYLWNNQQAINTVKKGISTKASQQEIENQLQEIISDSDIEFISVVSEDLEFSLGFASEKNYQFPTTRLLTESNQPVSINIQHHALKKILIIDRVILGASIIIGAILFGTFIFLVTQNVVNNPMHNLIKLTHKLSRGEKNVRFDEVRDDEFGELARFSNQMLDNLESQRKKLVDANNELMMEIQNREEALAASQQKSTFLANMSHEIRTPLSSIIGYTERLRYKKIKTEEEKNEMMDTVLHSSNHLLSLINDILDFSKIEANKLEVDAEKFSIFNVIDHTVNLLHDKAMEQSTEIKTEYTFPIPEFIKNDATRTKQILLNLCSNALRFTKDGKIKILISFDQINNQLVISVKDTGIGMPDEALNRLFKPFSQGERNTSKNYGGTGLGLAISKKLSELMGGNISVKSTEGLGSIFTFSINAGFESDQRLINEFDAIELQQEQYNTPIENIRLSGNVLLVEDTKEIRKLVKAYLEDYGIEITTANNGEQGVDMALSGDFDLVIMDIQMPVMNGKDAITLLRKKNYAKPVIALTADALTQQIEEYKSLGFTKTLTKPIVINDLIKTLSLFLNTANKDDSQITDNQNYSVNDAIAQLQESFINQLQQQMDDINVALENNDKNTTLAILHKLRGIGGSLGFPEITQQAQDISELLLKDGMESAKRVIIEFEKHIKNL